MMTTELEKAVFEAFLAAGNKLGARIKGMSCFVSNWKAHVPSVSAPLLRRVNRFTPADCPHCEYDRRFPGFEAGGWMQQDNNGPIVSCPLCNPDGKLTPRP